MSLHEKMSIAGGVPLREAELLKRAFQHVVDSLITNDVIVLLPPTVWTDPENPVWRRIRHLSKDPSWEGTLYGWDDAEENLADALQLPVDLIERYPIVADMGVLARVQDLLDLGDDSLESAHRMLLLWAEQVRVGGATPHRVEPVGRERDIEDWLVTNLESLDHFGFDIALADQEVDGIKGRQHRFPDLLRPDLIVRSNRDTDHLKAGDWLVIELKATAVGPLATDQLSTYVNRLQQTGTAHAVHGLLIADGATVSCRRALEGRGFHYLSLTQLGYRDLLWNESQPRQRDADDASVDHPPGQRL